MGKGWREDKTTFAPPVADVLDSKTDYCTHKYGASQVERFAAACGLRTLCFFSTTAAAD